MGIGLLAAAAIGFSVWRASVPPTLSATDTAMTTTSGSTDTETTSDSLPREVLPATTEEQKPQEAASVQTDDPFLAPNAFIPGAATTVTPRQTFRPSNPFEASPESSLLSASETTMPSTPAEPVPLESSLPSETPVTSPTTPTEPVETTSGQVPSSTTPVPPTQTSTTREPTIPPSEPQVSTGAPTPSTTPPPSPSEDPAPSEGPAPVESGNAETPEVALTPEAGVPAGDAFPWSSWRLPFFS